MHHKHSDLTAEETIFKAVFFLEEWHYNDSNMVEGSIHVKEENILLNGFLFSFLFHCVPSRSPHEKRNQG